MLVLIDNYDSFTYNLYQGLAILGVDVKVFRNDKITVEGVLALKPSHVVLSPGPGHPLEAGILVPLIHAVSGKIPLFGVCLGHQAIGCAMGGQVISAGEIVHGKSALITHTGVGLYANLPLPMEVGRYHSLKVDEKRLPKTLVVEATTHNGLIMGMRHREHLTFGVQFHPESVLTPDGQHLLQNFI